MEIDRNSKRYHDAKKRSERSDIVLEIASHVSKWGRFIEQAIPDGPWYMAALSKVRKKIGQALRYKIEFMEHERCFRKATDRQMSLDVSASSYPEVARSQNAQPCSPGRKRPAQATLQSKAPPTRPGVFTDIGDKRSAHHTLLSRATVLEQTIKKAYLEEALMKGEHSGHNSTSNGTHISSMKTEGEGEREDYRLHKPLLNEDEVFNASGCGQGDQGYPPHCQQHEQLLRISDAISSTSRLVPVRGVTPSTLTWDQQLTMGGENSPSLLGQSITANNEIRWPRLVIGLEDAMAGTTAPVPVLSGSQGQQLDRVVPSPNVNDDPPQNHLDGQRTESCEQILNGIADVQPQQLQPQQLHQLQLILLLQRQEQEQRQRQEEQEEHGPFDDIFDDEN